MTVPRLRVVGEAPPLDPEPSGQFFLIVADHDRGFFSVEGPMTDDLPWQAAARRAGSVANFLDMRVQPSLREDLSRQRIELLRRTQSACGP